MTSSHRARRIGAAVATAGLALATLVAISAPASAVTYPATDEASFRTAIADACDDTSGATIEVSGTITIAGSAPIICSNDQSLEIVGVGVNPTIQGAPGGAPLVIADLDGTLQLIDFTITDFTTYAVLADVSGSVIFDGMTVEDNSNIVTNVATNANAYAYGGAVLVDSASTVVVSESTFEGNTVRAIATGDSATGTSYAEAYGGAIYINTLSANVQVTDSAFIDNQAEAVLDSYVGSGKSGGGAIFVETGYFNVYNGSEFTGNNANVDITIYADGVSTSHYAEGGALNTTDGSITVSESTISGNSATGTGTAPADDFNVYGYGGFGVASLGFAAEGATFEDNFAQASGPDAGAFGGVFAGTYDSGTVEPEYSDFSGNFAKATVTSDEHTASALGGAFYIDSGTFAGDYNTFTENYAHATAPSTGEASEAYGGAIFAAGNVTVSDEEFDGNYALASGGDVSYAYGGAVESESGDLTFEASTLTGNSAKATGVTFAEVYGGAADTGEAVSVVDSELSDNQAVATATSAGGSAAAYGGGVAAYDDIELVGVHASDNLAKAVGPDFAWAVGGAAQAIEDGTVDIFQSEFADNTVRAISVNGGAFAFGGGVGDDPEGDGPSSVTFIERSTFAGNRAWPTGDIVSFAVGGGIFVNALDGVEALNSTFTDNVAKETGDGGGPGSGLGGAIMSSAGEATVTHVTMSGNEANAEGAHIFAQDYITTTASIFVDATGSEGCYSDDAYVNSNDYNVEDDPAGSCTDGYDGSSDVNVAGTVLAALADNGGPTRTMNLKAGDGFLDSIPVNTADFDQRGIERPVGAGRDPGAVEYFGALDFTITTDDGDIEGTVENAVSCGAPDVPVGPWFSADGYDPAPPDNLSVRYGVFTYIFCVPDGREDWAVTVTLTFPTPVNSFWKVSDTDWFQIEDAVISGNTVTYTITNNGPYDDDGSDDYILDPAAGGVLASFTG